VTTGISTASCYEICYKTPQLARFGVINRFKWIVYSRVNRTFPPIYAFSRTHLRDFKTAFRGCNPSSAHHCDRAVGRACQGMPLIRLCRLDDGLRCFEILLRLQDRGLPSLANPFSGQDVHWTSRLIRFTHAVVTADKHHFLSFMCFLHSRLSKLPLP
jgi:hypothetical protein